jgi:hypothetical protein
VGHAGLDLWLTLCFNQKSHHLPQLLRKNPTQVFKNLIFLPQLLSKNQNPKIYHSKGIPHTTQPFKKPAQQFNQLLIS